MQLSNVCLLLVWIKLLALYNCDPCATLCTANKACCFRRWHIQSMPTVREIHLSLFSIISHPLCVCARVVDYAIRSQWLYTVMGIRPTTQCQVEHKYCSCVGTIAREWYQPNWVCQSFLAIKLRLPLYIRMGRMLLGSVWNIKS